jgi:hypothetical protein
LSELVYYVPTETAHGIYASLKRFAADRKHGTGDWYEQTTSNGLRWLEKT